jgi:hypothetical protein
MNELLFIIPYTIGWLALACAIDSYGKRRGWWRD